MQTVKESLIKRKRNEYVGTPAPLLLLYHKKSAGLYFCIFYVISITFLVIIRTNSFGNIHCVLWGYFKIKAFKNNPQNIQE